LDSAAFQAAAGPGYSQHLLGLGVQPTCPCNDVLYAQQAPGALVCAGFLTVEAAF
jgi:hypothetical protein